MTKLHCNVFKYKIIFYCKVRSSQLTTHHCIHQKWNKRVDDFGKKSIMAWNWSQESAKLVFLLQNKSMEFSGASVVPSWSSSSPSSVIFVLLFKTWSGSCLQVRHKMLKNHNVATGWKTFGAGCLQGTVVIFSLWRYCDIVTFAAWKWISKIFHSNINFPFQLTSNHLTLISGSRKINITRIVTELDLPQSCFQCFQC